MVQSKLFSDIPRPFNYLFKLQVEWPNLRSLKKLWVFPYTNFLLSIIWFPEFQCYERSHLLKRHTIQCLKGFSAISIKLYKLFYILHTMSIYEQLKKIQFVLRICLLRLNRKTLYFFFRKPILHFLW